MREDVLEAAVRLVPEFVRFCEEHKLDYHVDVRRQGGMVLGVEMRRDPTEWEETEVYGSGPRAVGSAQ